MAQKDDAAVEVARFYTRTRNFPKFIGKFTDGTRIPGGPYTMPQIIALGVVLVIGFATKSFWSLGSMLLDIPVILGAGWGAAVLAGFIPFQRRNMFNVALSYIGASFKPAEGRVHGKTLIYRKPHLVRAGAVVIDPNDPYTVADPDRVRTVEKTSPQRTVASPTKPAAVPATSPAPAVSGAEALLLQMQVSK